MLLQGWRGGGACHWPIPWQIHQISPLSSELLEEGGCKVFAMDVVGAKDWGAGPVNETTPKPRALPAEA